jgi:hypothetical protein
MIAEMMKLRSMKSSGSYCRAECDTNADRVPEVSTTPRSTSETLFRSD